MSARHRREPGRQPRHHPASSLPVTSADVIELRVTLLEVEPPVWRVVAVDPSITLGALHLVIQAAMGWTNSHLHEFETADGTRYSANDDEDDASVRDASEVPLTRVLTEGSTALLYRYDFGDEWEHRVEFVGSRPRFAGERLPVCLAGERACPPEDSGGPLGYAALLDALGDPDHPEHEELTEWAGAGFDPDEFFVQDANDELEELFSTR